MKALKISGIHAELVDVQNDLEALQAAVGGYIETIGLQGGAVMIVDEEGRFKDYLPNPLASLIAGTDIVGDALCVGVDEDEFDDVPDDFAESILQLSEVIEGK